MPMLSNGEAFPALAIPAVGGGSISLPDDLAGAFGVVLIYRGAWCPYCNAQLAGFARAAASFADIGIQVVALSVDDEATSTALVEKHRLPFPVGYGADLHAVAQATGAYINKERGCLQTTGFVLDPDGKVITAVYSSGAIGRLTAEDVAGFVRYVKSHT